MGTCRKATLRVLFHTEVYLMIYLIIPPGILMMSISWAMLTSASAPCRGVPNRPRRASPSSTATPTRVISPRRCRAYLRDSSDWWTSTTPAKRCNRPSPRLGGPDRHHLRNGFADDYVAAAARRQSATWTLITSYASGSGSMARMNVGGFLSLTRTDRRAQTRGRARRRSPAQ